jgi:acetoin utilization protein AcuC
MAERTLAFIYSPELAALNYPPDCPFDTSRGVKTRQRLRSFGLLANHRQFEAPAGPASRAELEAFHAPRYLDGLQRAAAGQLSVESLHLGLGTPETPIFRDLWDYAIRAAGASLAAADLILAGTADIVFTPWGGFHHAFPEKASGFCYVNDVVLACMRLREHGKRTLFLDVDAHHGDGVQAAFYSSRDVMNISLHESGKTLFPWGGFEDEIGEGDGRGFNVNIPLPAQIHDDAYWFAFQQVAVPLIGAYRPDVIVVELGLDALAGDPLTHLRLTNNVFADVLRRLLAFEVPLLITGGGGYHVDNTVRGWTLAWQTLSGEEEFDPSIGMGGVMLGSAEWAGGLRDLQFPVTPEQRAVEPIVRDTVHTIARTVFPIHGLSPTHVETAAL